jgi:hypothetical protein
MVTRTIPLSIQKVQQIQIAQNATILGIGLRIDPTAAKATIHLKPELYVAENQSSMMELRTFLTLGPCSDGPNNGIIYIGSYHENTGSFVGHVFEVVDDAVAAKLLA